MERFNFKSVVTVAAMCLTAAFSLSASASVLVHVIQNDPSSGNASIIPSSSLPSADFTSPDINFNVSNSDAFSTAVFLNNPTFFNQQNGFNAALPADDTFLEITGSTFLNAGANSFVVGHDDGVVLTFADPAIGNVVNQPGPTGFVNTPFNVNAPSAGMYAFDLTYTECCGGPADLVFQINGAPVGPSVPEPATVALIGTGVVGLAVTRRRRRT
jgi:hypothetical protein